jgi:hypothetical protein
MDDAKYKEVIQHLERARALASNWKAHAVSRDNNGRPLHATFARQIQENIDEAERVLDREGWNW